MSTPHPLGITDQDYTAGLSEDNLDSHTGDKTGHARIGNIVGKQAQRQPDPVEAVYAGKTTSFIRFTFLDLPVNLS